MTLTINGEQAQHDADTIAELVATLRLPAPTLLIEHNGAALRRDEWAGIHLKDGDRLEILRIAAGG